MHYDKSKYEILIKESSLFEIDKESSPAAHARESYKMVEYLYCYLLAINTSAYEPYGSEIMEVATRCIKNFDASKGTFLAYFMAAWRQEYSHIVGDKIIDEKFHGMILAEEEKRNIRRYLRLVETIGFSISKQELYQRISKAMEISLEKILLLEQMSSTVVGSSVVGEEDEDTDIIEQLSNGVTIEQQLENVERAAEFLTRVDIIFGELQTRQKTVISDILTVRVWAILEELIRAGQQYCFVSNDIVQQYRATGVMPTQRQIADKHHRDEASVSRAMKEFLKKLKSIQ